jgi:phytoene synthase
MAVIGPPAALDAAGITDPALRQAYLACRRLHAEHGRTYYLATALLPPAKRPYVWALYGFARYADDLVDSLDVVDPLAVQRWSRQFLRSLSDGRATHPVAGAMLDTVRRWAIPHGHIEAFLASMQMDLTTTGYRTYADLERYMYGSAAVIGLQMLPVLEPVGEGAHPYARLLGEAFQMSNFIRDVGEDLERGRVYLPQEDLDAAGVSRADLWAGRRSASVSGPIRELLAFEVARTRELYARARPGIALLHPPSRDAIGCAYTLYGEILDAVEDAGYRILHRRVRVGRARRLAVGVPALLRATATRRRVRRPAPARVGAPPSSGPPAAPRPASPAATRRR